MDFSNTFKQGTRGFKKKPMKKVKKVESEEIKDDANVQDDVTAGGEVNKDLEDANMVVETVVQEIPRNITIT
jgi:hypothetical protein